MLVTSGFSFYIKHLSSASYMYGSLTSIILIMMWLYVCMQIVFFGAEFNYFFSGIMDKSEERSQKRIEKLKSKNQRKKEKQDIETGQNN